MFTFVAAVSAHTGAGFSVADFKQHALGAGSGASAIAYVKIHTADGRDRWGAGVDTNIELASIKAVFSALNRLE